MASVRISDRLMQDVRHVVQSIYMSKKLEHDKTVPDVGDELYNVIFGEHIATMDALPVEFFQEADAIAITHVDQIAINYTFKLSKKRRFPYSPILSAHASPSGPISFASRLHSYKLHMTDPVRLIAHAIIKWNEERLAMAADRQSTIDTINDLLFRHKTLAPAVKEYPPLAGLLQPHVRAKLRIPPSKLVPKQDYGNKYLNDLAIAIAMNKLVG